MSFETCSSCEAAMEIRDGQKSTGVCDECAQNMLQQKQFEIDQLKLQLASVTAERDEWRTTAMNAMSGPSDWEKGSPL